MLRFGGGDFLLRFGGGTLRRDLEDHHDREHDRESADQGNDGIADQAGDDVGHGGNGRAGKGIGHLGRNVVDVVALRAGARHDRCIGDGRAVVAADGAGHAGAHGDDHELGVGLLEAGDDDGDEDAEGAPARARGERQGKRQNACCNFLHSFPFCFIVLRHASSDTGISCPERK